MIGHGLGFGSTMPFGGASVQTLLQVLDPLYFLTPTSGQPGLNAVTGNEDFTLTGTLDAVTTGANGQAVIDMSAGDRLDVAAGFATDSFLHELHNEMQFWVFCYWDPQSDATLWQIPFQTSNTAAAGLRFRSHGNGSGGQIGIHDGSTNFTSTPVTDSTGGEWDNAGANCLLLQVDMLTETMTCWMNGNSQRTSAFHLDDFSALTFPSPASPLANTIPAQMDVNGLFMAAGGNGILTDDQIGMLFEYGKGISFDKLSAAPANRVISWRGQPLYNTAASPLPQIRVVGCFTEAPILKMYADGSRTTRGSLVKSSTTPITLDAQGWGAYTFTGGLTADTTYQIFAEYADGVQDRRRLRLKTLPASEIGLEIAFGGCWKWDPELPWTNATSLEGQYLATMEKFLVDTLPDVLVSSGDDGYYDNMWVDNLSGTLPMESVADYQTVHAHIFNQHKVDRFFSSTPFFHGCFSDHDFLQNDTMGADATAANIAAAQAHWTQRTGKTFPLAPDNMYHSWQTPGITWIAMDNRTEAEVSVQCMSTAQRAQMQTDATAAVGRGDLIILIQEWPWDSGEVPAPQGAWDHNAAYIAEREDIFDRLATAGVTDKIICVYGDQHAGGVDLAGTSQGGWDGGLGRGTGTVLPICILASRFNHGSAGSAAGSTYHPDYYDSGVGHWIKVDIAANATQLDVTVTPYEAGVAKTPIGPRTIG